MLHNATLEYYSLFKLYMQVQMWLDRYCCTLYCGYTAARVADVTQGAMIKSDSFATPVMQINIKAIRNYR